MNDRDASFLKNRRGKGGAEAPWRSVQAASGVPGVRCETYRCRPGRAATFPRHAHAEYQLYFNHDLPYHYEYRGARFLAPPRVLCMFPPGEVHGGEDVGDRETPSQFCLLYIEASRIRELAPPAGKRVGTPFLGIPLAGDPQMATLFLDAYQSLIAAGAAARLGADIALMRLAHGLWDGGTGSPVRRGERRPQSEKAVQRAQEYLHDNCTRNITLAELVDECGISGRHLHHAFSRRFGLPPHAYLLNIRIGWAKALLLQGTPISQIGHEMGYADQSHFTRCFHRLVGVTPLQYRSGLGAKTKS